MRLLPLKGIKINRQNIALFFRHLSMKKQIHILNYCGLRGGEKQAKRNMIFSSTHTLLK